MILKLFRVQRRRWTSTKLYYLNRCTLSNNLAEIVALAVWHHCGGASGCVAHRLRIDSDMRSLSARPGPTALAAGPFGSNAVTIICETGHSQRTTQHQT